MLSSLPAISYGIGLKTKSGVPIIVKRLGPNVLSRIDCHLVVITVERSKTFLVHCKRYHMVVGGKQKLQSEPKNQSDREINI